MVMTTINDENLKTRLNAVGENVAKVHFNQAVVSVVCLGNTYNYSTTKRVDHLYRDIYEHGEVRIYKYPYFSDISYNPDVFNYEAISGELNNIKNGLQWMRPFRNENKYIDFRIDTKSFSISTAKIILAPIIALVHELFLEKYDKRFGRMAFYDIYGNEIQL